MKKIKDISFLIKNKLLLVVYLLAVPVSCVVSVLFVLSFQPITDSAVAGDFVLFKSKCVYGLILAILDCIFMLVVKYSEENIINSSSKLLKNNLFSSILDKKIVKFKENNSGTYISTLTVDADIIINTYYRAILNLYSMSIGFIASFVTVVNIDLKISLILLSVGFLSFLTPKLFEKKLCGLQQAYSDCQGKYNTKIKDFFEGIEVIKMYNVLKHILNIHNSANLHVVNTRTKLEKLTFSVGWISIIFSSLMYIITFVVGGYLIIKGKTTAGYIVALSQLVGGVVSPLEGVPNLIASIKSSKPIRNKLYEILYKDVETSGIVKLEKEINSIELNNVSFSYNSKDLILNNISCKFMDNRKYCIVGKSGSGKTTLAKLLMNYYNINKGSISVNGVNINKYNKNSLYSNMSYINQNVFIFDDTFRNNICLYNDYSQKEIIDVIHKVGLDKVVNSLPNGIDSILKEGGSILSGGEKQRIGIARALITGTKVVIFDEATANLDNLTTDVIINTLSKLKDTMCIIITHNLHTQLIKTCDEILVFDKGWLIEKGDFKDLLSNKCEFYSMYNSAFTKY